MKKLTYDDIKALNPCYDPIKFISKDFSGTLIQILKMKKVPAKDRLWVVVRHTLMTDKQLHLYGLACAKMSEKYSDDPRVKECNKVTAKFLKGKASLEELRSAAWSAASAAWSAASAAESAASAAASAAWSAAWSAASAAESAARSAAASAASAAESAASAAESAAASAAWSAVEEKQCLALIKILKAGE